MLKKKLVSMLSLLALAGLAACGGGDVENADEVLTDTITTQETEMVEVPVEVTDTAVVQTEISVDTAIDVDTIQNP